MADNKKQKNVEDEVKTLRKDLDAITFKNKQAQEVAAIQAGKQKLSDKLARNRQRRVGAASRLSGLNRLQGLSTLNNK